jgi:integration host factor subunit beta
MPLPKVIGWKSEDCVLSFVKEYDGYTGRNPKTGEKVKIKPKKLPFFKPGKELKERVDR